MNEARVLGEWKVATCMTLSYLYESYKHATSHSTHTSGCGFYFCLSVTSITAPQDAHNRLVLQVWVILAQTLESSVLYVGKS